ncbi:(d)CMP kinase [Candidatus Protochlamydia phocaeensis]|uniref:(d)CMP kinase n=1 Tax=Candidatus Protochlamydia phocaeensis TaxID=1414722 RepID=UPI00083968E0|nr:(d)CMP kinase [Candidatus Protochlamydia phocaeensis]
MIITIDGPVATGKSTIAKKLAQAIGYIFFDTGAMYRALTYGILKHQVDIDNSDQLKDFLDHFQFDIKVLRHERHYFFEGEDITQKIRGEEVTSAVSRVSAKKEVRDKLVSIQRELAVGVNAVFEGRDMGTVVFPDAALKVFLTGRKEVRAQRRYDELTTKYPEAAANLTLEKCLEEITKRDHYDSTREHSPLKQAEDAFVVDTSDLTIDEVVHKILEYRDSLKTKRSIAS